MTKRDDSKMTEDVLELIEKERAYPDLSDREIESIRVAVQNVIEPAAAISQTRLWIGGAAFFISGTIVGALTYAALVPTKVEVRTHEVVRVERAPAAATPATPTMPTPPHAATETAVQRTSTPPARPERVHVATEPTTQERTLIEQARSALARSEYVAALSAVDQHQTSFAHGELCEERDAIRIQALIGAHRRQEAIDAATAFMRTYPLSLHRSAVSRALAQ